VKPFKAKANIYLMDELSIHLRIEQDDFAFTIEDIQNIQTFTIITNGNPGAVSIMLDIYKTYQDEDIVIFLNKIWKQQITGTRLWYIYKNEFNKNIEDLLSNDLTRFTNDYFYEKFEKYI